MRTGSEHSLAVVLSQCCFCSPIGNSRQEAVRHLRSGLSGITSLEGLFPENERPPFLVAGALSHPEPEDDDRRELHPRLGERYTRVLGNFFDQVREITEHACVNKLFLICKRPFYSKWGEASSDDFDELTFIDRVLERSGLDIHGRNVCHFQASCSSGLVALNLAIRELHSHPNQRILLMGLETELNPERFLHFKKLGILSAIQDPARACQPFSKEITGLVLGEVAVAVLLESRPRDRLRPADIVLTAGHSNSDGYRLAKGLESGQFVEECLTRTLKTLPRDEVDFVCPHGISTPILDQIEGKVLERVFASRARPIPVVPLKQYLGYTLNSSGLWETVLCAELLRNNFLPPLLNPDEQMSFENLQFEQTCRHAMLSKALKVAIGFGGVNSALLIEKVA